MPKLMKSTWFVLAVMLLAGGGVAVSTWIRGEHSKALQVLGLIFALALALLVADRSKRLHRRIFDSDERSDAIGLFAGTWAGWAFFLIVFICFLVENARGHSGEPYYWLSGLYVALFILFGIARSVRK
jgi:drug/metabolite transporter (DMT)-like permease